MPYTDTSLACSDCGATFPFTGERQALSAVDGATTPPTRCPSCRHLNRIWPAEPAAVRPR